MLVRVLPETSLQIVGAGPAGMSMVMALCNRAASGNRDARIASRILDTLIVFEADTGPGGKMGRYQINANTSSHDVVRGIDDDTPFAGVRDCYLKHPETQSKLISLPRIESLMVQPLAQAMRAYLGDRLQCSTRVARVVIGDSIFSSFDADDRLLAKSRNLLLCCGARETPLPGLLEWRDKWEGSDRFLLRKNLENLAAGDGPVIIVGASHSAFSCAWRLLNDPLFAAYAEDRDIVILQRRERIRLRCTTKFAARNRVEFDPEQDICPFSGMVYRNGGLRKDAKKLYLRIRDGDETRVRMQPMRALGDHRNLLSEAGLIVQATGFLPGLPKIEIEGKEFQVGKPSQRGELHDLANDRIVPGLFGMGLGLNILPEGNPRGEASFRGGIHGFQSYPLSIAPGLIDRLVDRMSEEKLH